MSINVTINGKSYSLDHDTLVSVLLQELHISPETVIISINRRVVDQDKLEDILVKDGDELELLQIVGGG